MAWGIPTIHRIVVGSTHKPDPAGTQQDHCEEVHSTTRGVLTSLESIYFFYVKIDLNSITKLVLIAMGTKTSKIYVKEEVQLDANIGTEEDQTALVPSQTAKKDHKFLSKSNPRRAGFQGKLL